MLRVGLFLAANFAILLLSSLVFSLFNIQGLLLQNGVALNLNALLIYSLIIGFSGSLISLFLSKTLAKVTMKVNLIERANTSFEQWLLVTVKRQSDMVGIKMPEVGIFEDPSPNAFATGWNKNSALVAVSSGLLRNMSQAEVEAVLAHEISHVANGDMVTLALIQGVVNTFVVFVSRIIGFIVDRLVFKVERGHGPAFWIVSIIAEIILGIFAMMIVMWFSRWREFRADAGGAALAGRSNMISALRRLQNNQDSPILPDEMAAFAINAGRVQALFASHPPLQKRIEVLQSSSS